MPRAAEIVARSVAGALVGLGFSERGGPLLAVAGLCGGAGASTLTHLVAAAAARESTVPVIAIDAGGPTGGLAAYAGVQTRRSLQAVAALVARGEAPDGLFVVADDGLRVLATGPRFGEAAPPAAVERILTDARAAHGLTVVDCGRLDGDACVLALSLATHVAWLLPATVSGLERGSRVLDACDRFIAGGELLCARHDTGDRRAPLARLAALADRRCATLALLPQVGDHHRLTLDERLDQAGVALLALAGVLAR